MVKLFKRIFELEKEVISDIEQLRNHFNQIDTILGGNK